jgi:hypothetical protein
MTTGPVTLRVVRRIDAVPTSTALLMAGPSALELWPGVRRVAAVRGRALVEAELPVEGSPSARTTAATVTAEPPHRTPTSFVTRFSWSGPDLPSATGVLTLSYAPGGQGTPSTVAELVLDLADARPGPLDEATLTALAEGFLANLARAAQDRRAA